MADPTAMFTIDDYSWSTFPPPALGLGPTEPGDVHVVLGMEEGGETTFRRLLPAQALRLAEELRARALVIGPDAAGTEGEV